MKRDNFKSQTERGEWVEQEEWMRVQFVSCLLKWDRCSASLRRFQDFTYRSFSFIAAEENNVTQNILMGNIRLGTTTQCFFCSFFSVQRPVIFGPTYILKSFRSLWIHQWDLTQPVTSTWTSMHLSVIWWLKWIMAKTCWDTDDVVVLDSKILH